MPAEDLAAWTAALHEAATLPADVRAEKAAQARTWAQGFRWAESYRRHLEVYRKVAGAR